MSKLFRMGTKAEDPKVVALRQEEEELAKAIAASLKETAAAPVQPSKPVPDPNVVSSDQEQDDIAKAIAESLKDTKAVKASERAEQRMSAASGGASLYPSFDDGLAYSGPSNSATNGLRKNQTAKEPTKVRAIYDFEAAEDNELTFQAGEIIMVHDNSDSNWWKGSNHRGEGLFPSNFVTTDLDAAPEPTYKIEKKSVQFRDEIEVKLLEPERIAEINEEKIDKLLHLLHEADPTGEKGDSEEILQLEEQCTQMTQLIDAKLEKVDKKHAALSMVNQQLMDALSTYHSLMKESLNMPYYSGPYMTSAFPAGPPQQQQYQPVPQQGLPQGQMPQHEHQQQQQQQQQQQYPNHQFGPGTCIPGTVMGTVIPTSEYMPVNYGPPAQYPAGPYQQQQVAPGQHPQNQTPQQGDPAQCQQQQQQYYQQQPQQPY